MSDLIDRQAAIDLWEKYHPTIAVDAMQYDAELRQLPPIQPKRGKWNRLDMDTLNCNKCGATFVLNQGSEKMHFCPNCGAMMKGENNESN